MFSAIIALGGWLLTLAAKLEAVIPLASKAVDLAIKLREDARERARLDRKAAADGQLARNLAEIEEDQKAARIAREGGGKP